MLSAYIDDMADSDQITGADRSAFIDLVAESREKAGSDLALFLSYIINNPGSVPVVVIDEVRRHAGMPAGPTTTDQIAASLKAGVGASTSYVAGAVDTAKAAVDTATSKATLYGAGGAAVGYGIGTLFMGVGQFPGAVIGGGIGWLVGKASDLVAK